MILVKFIKDLIKLIEDNNIVISYVELPTYIYGYYQYDSTGHYILINNSINLLSNAALHKCVIAEELGHFFTSTRVNNPLKNTAYNTKLKILKEEEKAIRWAANYLIPTNELIHYLSFISDAAIHEIANFFDVSQELLMKKFYMMSLEKGYWKILDVIYLCLDQYPSIYYAQFYDDKFVKIIDEYFE